MTVRDQVAERIYYSDSACTAFTATVTAIREMARVDGRQVWQIALDRTAFYPTSGGQPHDTGTLTATARSGATLDVTVTAVEEDDHAEVWHTTAKPLQEGTVVRGTVDAQRRSDHMQQHSGQHLLSALLLRQCGAATVSFHLGDTTSTIDLDVPSLTSEQLAEAERAANEAIAAALPLSIRTVPHDEAQAMLSAGSLRKLPPRSGPIRLIEIPGIDCNACGGTHVTTTAAIGPLLLRGTERVRGGIRLSFVCGTRAITAASADFHQITALAQSLSTAPAEIAGSITRLQADLKAAAKERAALLRALAELEAQNLIAKGTGDPVIWTLDAQQPGRDASYAKLLASHFIAAEQALTPAAAAPLTNPIAVPAALIIAPQPDRASVVLASNRPDIDCGTLLRTALTPFGGRGGGNHELAQGALPLAALDAWLASIQTLLRNATKANE